MTQTTVQTQRSKTTENYAVFDSPDSAGVQEIVGTYISLGVFGTEAFEGASEDEPSEYLEVGISAADEETDVPATLDKKTSNYGVYSTEADAIETMYVERSLLEEVGEGEILDEIEVGLSESDEEAFESAKVTPEKTEEEAAAIVGESEGDDFGSASQRLSEEASKEDSNSDEETVEISDEEAGLCAQ